MDFKEIEKQINDFCGIIDKYKQLYFANALAGEVGEYCNLIKKKYRDKSYYPSKIKGELADIFIYLSLNARVLNIDLEKAVLDKIKYANLRYESNKRASKSLGFAGNNSNYMG